MHTLPDLIPMLLAQMPLACLAGSSLPVLQGLGTTSRIMSTMQGGSGPHCIRMQLRLAVGGAWCGWLAADISVKDQQFCLPLTSPCRSEVLLIFHLCLISLQGMFASSEVQITEQVVLLLCVCC